MRFSGHIHEIWFSFGFLLEQELTDRIVIAGTELEHRLHDLEQ